MTRQELSLAQAAESVRVSRSTIWRWLHRGVTVRGRHEILRGRMLTNRWLIRSDDLQRFVSGMAHR